MTEILQNTTTHTRAWKDESYVQPPREQCLVGRWIVDASWAHPVWSQYWISMISLKDVPGLPPAHFYHPVATHEIQVWAVHPDHRLTPENPKQGPALLTPQNFIGQTRYDSDDQAREKLAAIVQLIVNGQMSPDTDFRRHWQMLFPFHPYA